jgi:hypothetical protein
MATRKKPTINIPTEGKFKRYVKADKQWYAYYNGEIVGFADSPMEADEMLDAAAFRALSK